MLVDSSVWIDYFNNQSTRETDYLHENVGIIPMCVGDLILAEVLQGFRSDKDFTVAKRLLAEFEVVELLGKVRALSAAKKYRELRKSGITIRKTIDVIIASYCIDEKVPLLFSDTDFNPLIYKMKLKSALDL